MRIDDGAVRVVVAADSDEWSSRAADHFLQAAHDAVTIRHAFHVVVPGGSTPRLAFAAVTKRVSPGDPLWERVHVYFGDERAVAPDHPDSNYRMIGEAWLAHARIPPGQVHRIAGELSPEDAATRYAAIIQAYLGAADAELPAASDRESSSPAPPRFDLVLLGLGPDGHVASLIPGRPLEFVAEGWVGVGQAPLSPARVRRVTLTAAALRSTREVAFWVRGADKADVVRDALAGGNSTMVPEVTPPGGRVTWILDSGAGSKLP